MILILWSSSYDFHPMIFSSYLSNPIILVQWSSSYDFHPIILILSSCNFHPIIFILWFSSYDSHPIILILWSSSYVSHPIILILWFSSYHPHLVILIKITKMTNKIKIGDKHTNYCVFEWWLFWNIWKNRMLVYLPLYLQLCSQHW